MKIKKISDVLGLKVFTDGGDFFGEIEEANIQDNRIHGWRIRVSSSMASVIGGARGVVIPHQFVKNISDVFIISQSALPVSERGSEEDLM